jgi:hypothetical protein
MKKKLFAVLFIAGLLSASAVDAKPENQKTPRWVKERWAQGYRCEKIENDLRAYGLPVKAFSYLAWRESRCKSAVIGWNYHRGMSHRDCMTLRDHDYKRCDAVRSYDSGLLQINSTWVTVTSDVCGSVWGDLSVLRKKNCNLRVAKHLFNNGGFVHWSITR